MKDLAMLKLTAALCANFAFLLSACSQATVTQNDALNEKTISTLPPLSQYLSCLPREAALTAAHRGTAYDTQYPENSMSGLAALMDKGFLVSEIDVAGLKDGVHILYHDGVWDEKSTGKGPVASTTWSEAEKILLEDTLGEISADRPVKLEDYLKTAKGKIYLEIDFKSSAKYEDVIALIREHDMSDQVILISYNERQSKKLARLAPEMMLSIGSDEALGQTRYKPGQVAAWIGYNTGDTSLVQALREKDIPILGRIRKNWNPQAADAANLLVSDNIFNVKPIVGLSKAGQDALENCLAKL